jgi:protein N-lysine methyltransferase METTL21A
VANIQLPTYLILIIADRVYRRLAVALGCRDFQTPLWITDQVPMLALMDRNIALNALSGSVNAAVYDWGNPAPAKIPQHPDVILAADCVYFEPAFPLLQQTLSDLIGDNTTCYFCFKRRRRADMQFVKTIKKMFNVSDVDDDPDRATYARQNIHL